MNTTHAHSVPARFGAGKHADPTQQVTYNTLLVICMEMGETKPPVHCRAVPTAGEEVQGMMDAR
jgi:hypothetical protein